VPLEGRVFGSADVGVVLAHMRPGDQSQWLGFAALLADQGYQALISQPGRTKPASPSTETPVPRRTKETFMKESSATASAEVRMRTFDAGDYSGTYMVVESRGLWRPTRAIQSSRGPRNARGYQRRSNPPPSVQPRPIRPSRADCLRRRRPEAARPLLAMTLPISSRTSSWPPASSAGHGGARDASDATAAYIPPRFAQAFLLASRREAP
jgi:hypothetical protein